MSTSGLTNITVSELSVQNQILLGDNLDNGSAGQVLISGGDNNNVSWSSNSSTILNPLIIGSNLSLSSGSSSFNGSISDTINATDTNTQLNLTAALPIVINDLGGLNKQIDIDIDTATMGVSGGELEVLQVPNNLIKGTNINFSSGTTYNGSSAITISAIDTNTTYQGSSTINIDTSTTPDTINVLKVPNVITAGANISMVNTDDGASATTYDGSEPITITATSSGTTYQGGTNINIDTSTTPDSINLDVSIMNQTLLMFNQSGITTAIIGSAYPNKPTITTYLDLSSATNTIPGGVLATKIQQTYLRRDISTTYIEYSSNFRTSFVAQSASVMVEFYAVIAAYSSKLFYGALYDYINSQFFATSQTRHRFKFDNGLDQDPTSCMWYLTGLTAGTTYYISPYFKSSKATSYIYAGNSGAADSFAPAIMRIYDGGNNVDIY